MQKKWGIVLAIINIACLVAVTGVSIVAYAANVSNSKTIKSDKSTVTVIGQNIPAKLTAGKQIGDAAGEKFQNEVTVTSLSTFSIGAVEVVAGGFVNIWFKVENTGTSELSVLVALTNGSNGTFSAANVTTGLYKAIYAGEENCTDIDEFLNALNTILFVGGGDIESDLLGYDILIPSTNTIKIPAGKTMGIIVRFNVGAAAANFDIGINLTFSV